jgi:hypothetical protein
MLLEGSSFTTGEKLVETHQGNGYASPGFVDVDADGDMDLFVGTRSAGIMYWENVEGAFVPRVGQEENPLFNCVGNASESALMYTRPVFLDVDLDGDSDAYVATVTGDVLFFNNSGNITNPLFVLQPAGTIHTGITGGFGTAVAFADLDADGDMDMLVTAAGPDKIYFYNNTGSASAPNFSASFQYVIDTNGLDSLNLALTDLDGECCLMFFTQLLTNCFLNRRWRSRFVSGRIRRICAVHGERRICACSAVHSCQEQFTESRKRCWTRSRSNSTAAVCPSFCISTRRWSD